MSRNWTNFKRSHASMLERHGVDGWKRERCFSHSKRKFSPRSLKIWFQIQSSERDLWTSQIVLKPNPAFPSSVRRTRVRVMWKPEASGGTKRRDLDFTAKPETSCEKKNICTFVFFWNVEWGREREGEKNESEPFHYTFFFCQNRRTCTGTLIFSWLCLAVFSKVLGKVSRDTGRAVNLTIFTCHRQDEPAVSFLLWLCGEPSELGENNLNDAFRVISAGCLLFNKMISQTEVRCLEDVSI